MEIHRLAAIGSLQMLDQPVDGSGYARLIADGAELLIPLEGILDLQAERDRLAKRAADVRSETETVQRKLANEGFLAKAPAEVVEKQRARLAELNREADALAAQLAELG